jgi:hypothetical protein
MHEEGASWSSIATNEDSFEHACDMALLERRGKLSTN